jgi:hypothetical protein
MLGILVGRSSLFVWVEKLGCYEWKSWILWGVGNGNRPINAPWCCYHRKGVDAMVWRAYVWPVAGGRLGVFARTVAFFCG